MFHTATKTTCETDPFVKPESYQPFYLRYTGHKNAHFVLDTINDTEPLHITCLDEDPMQIFVNSTGIISIAPKCTATSAVVTLLTTKIFKSEIQKSYEIICVKPYVGTNDISTVGRTLNDIAEQAEEIAKHERTQ